MKYLEDFSFWIQAKTGLDGELFLTFLLTLFSFFIFKIIKICLKNILMVFEQKKAFRYYQTTNIILTMINVIIIFVLWDKYLDNIITIISFVSAALTLALRELIFNFFAGIYIKMKKPFVVEDRIEVNGIKGDVINISSLNFEILEVDNNGNSSQSTGIAITIPNSFALTTPIKNEDKNFKYIWSEIVVKTTLDADVEETKKKLLEIIKQNEVVKRIPKKMQNEMEDISLDYRIYYNKLDPIVYMKVVDSHMEFSIRYLVHPKKNRYVEDDVWSKILKLHHNHDITLYKE